MNISNKEFSPLISADKISENLKLKLEYKNPSLSMKHRCIPQAVTDKYNSSELNGYERLAIVSAGCAGISLAWIAKRLGFTAIVIVPKGTVISVINYCKWLGAELIESEPAEIPIELDRVKQDCKTYFFDQLNDSSLPQHYQAVGSELLEQHKEMDAIVVAAGSAASAMGIANAVEGTGIKIYVVEPDESRVLAGFPWKHHSILGLAPPIQTKLFDKSKVDELIGVKSEQAWFMSQQVQQKIGESVGPSSGATIFVAQKLLNQRKVRHVVAICASHISISI